MSVFDKDKRAQLQADVLSGKVDSDALLPDLVEWVSVDYFNLFCNLETGERAISPVSRRGNPQYALRQSYKKSMLVDILRKAEISHTDAHGNIWSHLFFQTLTIDHSLMSRDEANLFITSKGGGISHYFARFSKCIEGGYSKVLVKESTKSGYPAVHIILNLEKPLKVRYHRKSDSYRPDPSDPYTRKVLSQWKNLLDWNSHSPIWMVGFLDVYAFTKDHLSLRGHSNPINYIAKYISKSLDLGKNELLRTCKRVSELPAELRTRVWTILNNLIWNSQTWVISKAFKDDLRKLEEEKEKKSKGLWMWVNILHRDDPRLRSWMGLSKEDVVPNHGFSIAKLPDTPKLDLLGALV